MKVQDSPVENRGRERPVVYVGNFLPPVTGQKFLNQRLADLLVQHGTPLQILTSLPLRPKSDPLYTLAQLIRVATLPVQLLLARAKGSTQFVYSLLGGKSRLIDLVNVSAARLLGYKITLYHHSSQFARTRSRVMSIIMALSRKNTSQIMASPKMAADFTRTYGLDEPIKIIDNSAYVDQQSAFLRRDRPQIRLGLLSNLTRSKGLDAAIDTLETLLHKGCDCQLFLAGPVNEPEAKELIEQAHRKFQDRIEVLGPVSGLQKDQFFRSIDIFLFPSTHQHETQSLVVSEAQSYGCPAIVIDHAYVAENIPEALKHCALQTHVSFKDGAARIIQNWINNPIEFSATRDATFNYFEQRHHKASNEIQALAEALKQIRP